MRELRDGEPCNHKGCLSHISHPCEGCGRIAGKQIAEADTIIASVRCQKENTLPIDHQCSLPDYIYKLIDIPILIEATYPNHE